MPPIIEMCSKQKLAIERPDWHLLTPEFFLIGPAIDISLIEELLRHRFSLTTHRMWLVETGADAKIFDLLGACIGLKTHSLRKNPALRADLDEQILQQLRDLTVEFS